jgi:hypothetical protein
LTENVYRGKKLPKNLGCFCNFKKLPKVNRKSVKSGHPGDQSSYGSVEQGILQKGGKLF